MKSQSTQSNLAESIPETVKPTLADPSTQDLFVQQAPNALSPDFIYSDKEIEQKDRKDEDSESEYDDIGNEREFGEEYVICIHQATHETGLKDANNHLLQTTIWGYGADKDDAITVTWPGKTFEVKSGKKVKIKWNNNLKDSCGKPLQHILPVDESLHWCYSLTDQQRSLAVDGVPLVPHLHGAHSFPEVDGNPEYFEGITENSRGPRFVSNEYEYDNSQPAGTLWYHDHALGLTRLNVYTGLAGFYIVRDEHDSGNYSNDLGLPANQYELAYCVQDRMFEDNGELYYPAYSYDNAWGDFIDTEVAQKLPDQDGPSALAEFFGDHILVNGKLWPKTDVEQRHYRMRLLNGCDSRFMKIQFRSVPQGETDLVNASAPLTFTVIGSDQGFLEQSVDVKRLDIVFDFSSIEKNSRIIMQNILGDEPFKGQLPDASDLDPERRTDRIMAFDVAPDTLSVIESDYNNVKDESSVKADRFCKHTFDKKVKSFYKKHNHKIDNIRKLGLYEGSDEFGRLMPMLGTAEEVTDVEGNRVSGAMTWSAPVTENPALGSTEVWEIYNATEDAHPIHVHLVNFEILSRDKFTKDSIEQPVLTHSGDTATGSRLENIEISGDSDYPVLETEKGPKDMVICYPGEVTRIKMTFDRAGRYVWHCHILSHEDHEMMRVFHVGELKD